MFDAPQFIQLRIVRPSATLNLKSLIHPLIPTKTTISDNVLRVSEVAEGGLGEGGKPEPDTRC